MEALQYPQNGMEDLYRILPDKYTHPQCIPKTIIYFDEIELIFKAMKCLSARMKQLDYPKTAAALIKPYFSWLNTYDKTRTADAFACSNDLCNEVRILCSTDAYGLGVDNPDVVRVINGWPRLIPKL